MSPHDPCSLCGKPIGLYRDVLVVDGRRIHGVCPAKREGDTSR